MTKPNTSTSNLNLTSGHFSAGNFISRSLFLLRDIQILEILIAIIVFIVIHSLRQKKHHGLPIWPVLGMLPSLVTGVRINTYEWLTDILSHQNGTFRFKGPWFSSLNSIITSDPRNIEHLLKTNFTNFPKGTYFKDTVRDLLGDGIFNADNETWQKQRKTASIEFHSTKFRQLTTDSLYQLVHSRLLPVLESCAKKSVAVDLQEILLRLTFDNVCMIAFGVDPGCLSLELPEIPFAKAFEDATEATVHRFVTPTCIWKFMRFLNLGMERKLRESIKGVDEFAENVIRTRKKELSLHCDEDKKLRSDLLTIFMKLKDEDGKAYSDKFLRDICVNFVLAGRDTSSVALSWFFWLLHQNPEVEDKILEEICRVVVEDDTFPDGTMLKKGMKVIYAIYAMGRMEAIWGKDCKEFKPNRWLRNNGQFMSESAYKFSVFNGGPRLCLGKDFAYYQMKYVAASIIFHYHVKVVQNYPVVPKLALTMYMKHGIKVNLYNRDAAQVQKCLENCLK
ncbi:unnamed protein product [Lupinus luteus]|uniref:Cytochrome P450 n=1 Tax=Lupinus luteus TaxID=3873 RepID=A0AAV1YJL8_LUPLU